MGSSRENFTAIALITKMSLLVDNQVFESNAKMNNLKLSKFGFGFKLKKFLSIWSWTGMILSLISGVASFIIIIVCCTILKRYAEGKFPIRLIFWIWCLPISCGSCLVLSQFLSKE